MIFINIIVTTSFWMPQEYKIVFLHNRYDYLNCSVNEQSSETVVILKDSLTNSFLNFNSQIFVLFAKSTIEEVTFVAT